MTAAIPSTARAPPLFVDRSGIVVSLTFAVFFVHAPTLPIIKNKKQGEREHLSKKVLHHSLL
jgi:hypothetical protein